MKFPAFFYRLRLQRPQDIPQCTKTDKFLVFIVSSLRNLVESLQSQSIKNGKFPYELTGRALFKCLHFLDFLNKCYLSIPAVHLSNPSPCPRTPIWLATPSGSRLSSRLLLARKQLWYQLTIRAQLTRPTGIRLKTQTSLAK